MLFDVILLAAIIIFTIIGYFKGFLSQFSSVIGIILAYWLSPKWVHFIQGPVRDLFPFSYVISDMFSRLFIGILIFILVKLIGKIIEFMFTSKVKELGTVNRWGGFFFGFLKTSLFVMLLMTFVTLIPNSVVKKRFGFLESSATYRLSKKYNPVINPQVMESIRKVSSLLKDPKKLEIINKSAVYNDYLKTKNLKNPLTDEQSVDGFQKGDAEMLKREGILQLLEDKDFVDFIYGEKYYKQTEPVPPSKK